MEHLRPECRCCVQRSMPVARSCPAPSTGAICQQHLAARIDRHRALERSGSEGRASCPIMINDTMYARGAESSVIREIFTYANERKAQIGAENVFDFSLGNPSVPAPDEVRQSIERSLKLPPEQVHGYTPAPGAPEVRTAVAESLNRRFGTNYTMADVFMTVGAAASVSCTLGAVTCPGDEVIVIAPYFPEYRVFIESAGAKMAETPANPDTFQIDFDRLAASVNEHTKGVFVNSPNNPSGVVYTEESIRQLAAFLEEKSADYGHPIYLIADEPYRELVYGDVEVPYLTKYYKNTLVCYSYSKSLSLPGERIGYVFVGEKCEMWDEVFNSIVGAAREIGSVCPPTLIQKVIGRCVGEMPNLEAYDENRQLLFNSLSEMGYEMAKPDGAFYMFVKAPNGDAVAFSEKAKLEHNLLVVPGDGFECPGYFRLSYCVSNDMIKRSLPAFKAMIESYK